MSRKEASDFNWLSNQFAVDRRKLAWLLNENCSASNICVSFRRPLQHKIVLFENTSSLWAETIREKEEYK